MDWATLQAEQAEWSKRNFGEQPGYQMVLGMVEEAGELAEAGTAELVADAVGDIVVFMSGYCTTQGIQLTDVFEASERVYESAPMVVFLGRICHAHLKAEQRIRGTSGEHVATKVQSMAGVIQCARHALVNAGSSLTLEDAVRATWSSVKQRDWKKAPSNGIAAP